VAEAPAAMECRVFQILPQGEGPMHGTWVIGEVLHLWVRDELLAADGLPDTAKVHPAARMGRDEWASIETPSIFRLPRPTVAPPTP
jgi:flavin reductase (DIM6/NTAB) family NADH-FMN oxidoreductase RutF